MIYLDYAATTPIHPEVTKEMLPFINEYFGNPSSIYECGRFSKTAIEVSRNKVAKLIGADDDEIVFTSGGTEADNLALKGICPPRNMSRNHIITSVIEHHAVLETCNFLKTTGYEITFLPVDEYGLVRTKDVEEAITEKTALLSIMHANNEIGTIEPISEISQIAKKYRVYFHTDAVQTVGHIPVNVNDLGVDLLSISAHKFYGPKGIGALYVRRGTELYSFLHGGGQERGFRAGTENVAGLVGFGKAAELALQNMDLEAERLSRLRDEFIRGILYSIESAHLNGHPVRRLPNNVNISIDSVDGETIVIMLDSHNICASTGSACSSRSLGLSHVLSSLGVSYEKNNGSVRFSLVKWTSEEDIEKVLNVLRDIVATLKVR